jgi:hypothetical protein
MRYMMMLYIPEGAWPKMTEAERKAGTAAYMTYTKALGDAGVLVGTDRLEPSTAGTTIRTVNGKAEVLDGPYADTKEQLGGYYLIDVPDLDAALAWASKCPTVGHGVVELRPIWAGAM